MKHNLKPNNCRHNKIRVAVVCPNYGLVGGAEGFAFELTERLAETDDFEIHVFAEKWREGSAFVTFHRIRSVKFPRWLRPVSFAWFTKRAINKGSFDIIHSHERLFYYDLLTHHGFPHKFWIKKIRKKRMSLFDLATSSIERRGILSSRLPVIMPVSQMAKDILLEEFDIPDKRVKTVHPGHSFKRFSQPVDRREEIRDKHQLIDDDIVILFVGMNFDVKGLDRLLKSVSEFTDRGVKHPSLKLLIVGKGNLGRYMSIASHLKIDDRIRFAGVSEKVEDYYTAADIFAIPSYLDSFGIVVLEAMAASLPVIVSETVGAADIIDHGRTGFILKDKDFQGGINEALSSLLHEPLRIEMGALARETARIHDWDEVAKKIAALYRQRMDG